MPQQSSHIRTLFTKKSSAGAAWSKVGCAWHKHSDCHSVMHSTLSEGCSEYGYTSYSVKKGEEIVLCIRKSNNYFVDINTKHELHALCRNAILYIIGLVQRQQDFWTDSFEIVLVMHFQATLIKARERGRS